MRRSLPTLDPPSRLHQTNWLIPNERYLGSILWKILDRTARQKVIDEARLAPLIADKLKYLLNSANVYDENPYYAAEDVSRYQIAPPICRPIDYIAYHPWSELWNPDRRDTWFKAKEILEARFKAQDLNKHQRGLLGGWADEQHCAPPAIVFRSNQDPNWTREAVESGEIESNQVNLEDLQLSVFDAADAAIHRRTWGTGLPRGIDWAKDEAECSSSQQTAADGNGNEENDASRSPISKITTTQRTTHESNPSPPFKSQPAQILNEKEPVVELSTGIQLPGIPERLDSSSPSSQVLDLNLPKRRIEETPSDLPSPSLLSQTKMAPDPQASEAGNADATADEYAAPKGEKRKLSEIED